MEKQGAVSSLAGRKPYFLFGTLIFLLGILFVGLTRREWYTILAGSKEPHPPEARLSPPYVGPAKPGEKLPAFTATLADGSTFSNQNLQEGKPTLMVFFVGKS